MALSNRDRVGKALDILRIGLSSFVSREFQSLYHDNALTEALRYAGPDRNIKKKALTDWDVSPLLKVMWDSWNEVFGKILGRAERSLVQELIDWRNKWAHQENFSSDDAERALDSMARLLAAVSAPEADEVTQMKRELSRLKYDEQVRQEKRKVGGSLVEGAATGVLKPWREVITPHPDVARGSYQQAEFAADLWQVHLGQASAEYQDPKEFFRRTFLTASLKELLTNGVKRLSGQGGDPVIQLQTNFGGGKTHSMLAIYHLMSGAQSHELPGADEVLANAGIQKLPKVKRVVLVGNKISPGNPVSKPDGTIVRTLWGEMAYQLGGKKAFARVKADDEKATSPGDALRELFVEYGPCLILIDEWVAYARQLHEQSDLPAGSFETQFSFAQALTESAKLAKNCLLIVSLPASDTHGSPHAQAEDAEVGGIRGREALDRLRNVIGRLESSWRPATAEEGFEIVRRRLFEPLTGEAFKLRDVAVRSFADLYRAQATEFPLACSKSNEYEERMKSAYPIHPEIFDQLYDNWSTLVKFQRTRGVLRLMAAVIHCLWENDDKNPLILPSTIPIDDHRVQSELTRYLSDNWAPIIEKNVDGPDSLPRRIDADNPNFGKYSATRRVARTIYLGSAPIASAARRGIEDRQIRLGCVMPGEAPALFGDALRRLAAKASHLYQDGPHYWYSTQPNVNTVAEDRAEVLKRDPDKVVAELEKRVRTDIHRKRGEFSSIHDFPRSGADVPDDMETRMVVLSPEHPCTKEPGNPAETAARGILAYRGNTPRIYQNTLVFLAADKTRMQDLDEALRRYLAWESILQEKETLNLNPHQTKQAEMQKQTADTTVTARLPEVYQWLLVPVQKDPQTPMEWQTIRLTSGDPIAVRASKKLCNEELLLTAFGPARLRMELDRIPLWRGDHIPVKQLMEDFARYLYLPRLLDPSVFAATIRQGIEMLTWEKDSFAYAESYDEAASRYRGLLFAAQVPLTERNLSGLLVKPEVAIKQTEAEKSKEQADSKKEEAGSSDTKDDSSSGKKKLPGEKKQPKRFHGTATLDPNRVGRDASRIADEVIAHLAGLVGSEVSVTLEIVAKVPGGTPEQVVRTVTENCRTMKFESQGFEEE
ncbi:MAG TPA: Swt1 family HEPN domain-containing protein [bacterium]|nr:Swt1 family HEPN domain-containing protein [bacterium]